LCEVHPSGISSGPSGLAIRGFFLCRDNGGDIIVYNDLMYKAVFADHIDIESVDGLAAYISDLIDPQKFKKILVDDPYKTEIQANNNRAWRELGMEAVPSFRAGGKSLYAIPGVGVPEEILDQFLSANFEKNKMTI